jgi:cytochrome c oxidase cbb3-type subunit II
LEPAPHVAAVITNLSDKAALVGECIDALDRSGVPSDAGAPTARKALRDAGCRFGNNVISAAVRERKMRAS